MRHCDVHVEAASLVHGSEQPSKPRSRQHRSVLLEFGFGFSLTFSREDTYTIHYVTAVDDTGPMYCPEAVFQQEGVKYLR